MSAFFVLSGIAATQEEKEKFLAEFVESGDTKKLIELKNSLSYKYTLAEARFLRQILRAIPIWDARWEKEREPVREILRKYDEDSKQWTDHPMISSKFTKPEDVSNPEYRRRYIEFLEAMGLNSEQAGRGGSLHRSERSIRNRSESIEERLTPGERAQLDREEAKGDLGGGQNRNPEEESAQFDATAPAPQKKESAKEPAASPEPDTGDANLAAGAAPEKSASGIIPAWLPWAAGAAACLVLVVRVVAGKRAA